MMSDYKVCFIVDLPYKDGRYFMCFDFKGDSEYYTKFKKCMKLINREELLSKFYDKYRTLISIGKPITKVSVILAESIPYKEFNLYKAPLQELATGNYKPTNKLKDHIDSFLL